MGAQLEDLLGHNVSEQRRLRGLTQEQLAERVSVSVETISRIERGRVAPSLTRLSAIARAIGIEPFELLRPNCRLSGRSERALARVSMLLRARPAKEIEMFADVIDRFLRG